MKRLFIACILCALPCSCIAGCGVEGLHNAKPLTYIKAGEFSFSNSKDVEVALEEGGYDPATKSVSLKNLKISDNASVVRKANVEQIDALGRESLAVGQAWASGFAAAAQLATSVMPWAAGSSGSYPPGWTSPTTQPSGSGGLGNGLIYNWLKSKCPTCGK
jgi:hypothetical protein